MAYRPLHEVIVARLAHLCQIYATEAGVAGKDGVTDKLVRLGAEIHALCAVLDNGVVPFEHLTAVIECLRGVKAEWLSYETVRDRDAAMRVGTLCANLERRGRSVVDGLRPLHEVLLRWADHKAAVFVAAVRTHNEDKVFCAGAEIQACATALVEGVVPASEIRGAIEWLGRLIDRLPRGAEGPTIDAVAVALRTVHADLENREVPSPAFGTLVCGSDPAAGD